MSLVRNALWGLMLLSLVGCVRQGFRHGGDHGAGPPSDGGQPEAASADTSRLDGPSDGAPADLLRDLLPGDLVVHDTRSPDVGVPAPSTNLVKTYGGSSADVASGLAIDTTANVHVVGSFSSTVDLGDGNEQSAGAKDIFLAKYDANGAARWVKTFGASNTDIGSDVAVDSQGRVALVGYFQDRVDFGGPNALQSKGSYDIVLALFNKDGSTRWAKGFGGTTFDMGHGVAFDSSGNITITGTIQGGVDFGGGTRACGGAWDIFVASFDANGGHRWSRCFGAGGDDFGYAVTTDAAGAVYVTGRFSRTVNFGKGALTAPDAGSLFVVKFNGQGVTQWAKRHGDPAQNASGEGIIVGPQGELIVTGSFKGKITFGPMMLSNSGGLDHLVVARLDRSSGAPVWAKALHSVGAAVGHAVSVDASGRVYVVGDFGGNALHGTSPLVNAGGKDACLLCYDSIGKALWGKRFGGAAADQALGVAVNGNGRIFLGGKFSQTASFDGAQRTAAGSSDIFWLRVGP